jgi:hypothetical protein
MDATPRKLAIRLAVADLLRAAGVAHPPVDLARVARAQGITTIRHARMRGTLLGTLTERSQGLTVTLNEREPLKARFTLAHEIAHTLVEPTAASPVAAVLTERRPRTAGARERLCDDVAAEILMPHDLFGAALEAQPLSIDGLRALAGRFQASLQSTARRIGELSARPVEVLCWVRAGRWAIKPSLRSGLRLLSGDGASSQRSLSDKTSPIVRAFLGDGLEVGAEAPAPEQTWNTYRCEAKGFMKGQRRFVISLITPSESPA